MSAPRLAFFFFVSDENSRSQEGEPGTSAPGQREKQQPGLGREEASEAQPWRVWEITWGRVLQVGWPQHCSGERALPLPRVVELWGTQGTLTPEELRVPSEGWQVCEVIQQEPREPPEDLIATL